MRANFKKTCVSCVKFSHVEKTWIQDCTRKILQLKSPQQEATPTAMDAADGFWLLTLNLTTVGDVKHALFLVHTSNTQSNTKISKKHGPANTYFCSAHANPNQRRKSQTLFFNYSHNNFWGGITNAPKAHAKRQNAHPMVCPSLIAVQYTQPMYSFQIVLLVSFPFAPDFLDLSHIFDVVVHFPECPAPLFVLSFKSCVVFWRCMLHNDTFSVSLLLGLWRVVCD
jgi:hypothetical protein